MSFMKCNSHRARDRLCGVLGKDAQCYYSFKDKNFHGVYWVPENLIARAQKLKGVTRARQQDSDYWLRCW